MKIVIECHVDCFSVYEIEESGDLKELCNFWSYEGDSFDAFEEFLKKTGFDYIVVDMV